MFRVVDEESDKTWEVSTLLEAYKILVNRAYKYRYEEDYPNLYIVGPKGERFGFGTYFDLVPY